MNTIKKIFIIASCLIAVALIYASCSEGKIPEGNEEPFIILEQDSVLLRISGNEELALPVLLCAAPHKETVFVDFEISSDSLTLNTDFHLLNEGYTLSYPQGEFNDTIYLSFQSNAIPSGSLYLVEVALTTTSAMYNLGYPGPGHMHIQTRIYITKDEN